MNKQRLNHLFCKADGALEVISASIPFSLKQLQDLVGGYIEFIGTDINGVVACVNEEGRIKKFPENKLIGGVFGSILFGKIVNGDFIGFSSQDVERIKSQLSQ